MKKIIGFILKSILKHKIISLIVLAAIIAGGYFGYQKLIKSDKDATKYIAETVEKGMLISSISGAGQVSASNQIDIKSTVSGDIISLKIKNGQEVKTGDLLAQIDDSETQKEARNAKIALENAQLDLDDLLAPPDEIDVLKAENSLAAAKRNLEELINPSEDILDEAEAALISAQNSLVKLKLSQEDNYQDTLEAKQKAEDDLETAYEEAFGAVADVFLDLPALISNLENVLYGYEIANSEIHLFNYQWNSKRNASALEHTLKFSDQDEFKKITAIAKGDYQETISKYNESYKNYKNIGRYSDSDKDVIEALLEEDLDTLKKVSQAIKSEIIALQSWIDYRSQEDLYIFGKATEYQADLETYALTVDSHLSILLSTQESLEDEKETISEAEQSLEEMQRDQPIDLAAAERIVQEKEDALDKLKNPEQYDINDQEIAVKEKELALEKLKAGADDIDIRSKKLLVRQKYEALLAVQEKLAEHNIKAPFDGTVASINISKGDAVTSATVIGTVITEQKIVEVTLNEIDIADVKTGQNATIEFDAVADLTVTGKVIEVDALGAVTQGVVSYKIKIAFDVDDNRIKPGMTASASIIIDSKQDVLLVPLSAVKAAGENSYLEILIDGQSQRRDIVIGSSNDTMIEIIEGIKEGEQVITQTITSSNASQSATASAQNSRNNQTQNANPMQGMMRMMR